MTKVQNASKEIIKNQLYTVFVCVDALHSSRQFFSHVWTFPGMTSTKPRIYYSVLLKDKTQCLRRGSKPTTPRYIMMSTPITITTSHIHMAKLILFHTEIMISK